MNRTGLILIAILCHLGLRAQIANEQDGAVQTDTLGAKKIQLLAVPLAFYTPETNLGFGAGAQMFFKTKNSGSDQLNSNILATVIYTLNKQLIISASSQTYFLNRNYLLEAKFGYRVFPNLFWGIGSTTPEENEEFYSPTDLTLDVSFIKRIHSNFNFGLNFSFADYKITEIEPGGILDTAGIEGSEGARTLGLGLVLNIDSRDNTFSPLGGSFSQFKTNFASRAMGSTHSFNVFQLDLRKYFRLGGRKILAAQFYTRLTLGEAPFQSQSFYGGGDLARGFYRGRYIDDNLYLVQLEYRMPLASRWEFAVFALSGNVGSSGENSNGLANLKSSFGLGPRFFIYKNKRTLLRLDLGINSDGGTGIYFGVNEAF
jgi:outer membrane protein assembly factor BamA